MSLIEESSTTAVQKYHAAVRQMVSESRNVSELESFSVYSACLVNVLATIGGGRETTVYLDQHKTKKNHQHILVIKE